MAEETGRRGRLCDRRPQRGPRRLSPQSPEREPRAGLVFAESGIIGAEPTDYLKCLYKNADLLGKPATALGLGAFRDAVRDTSFLAARGGVTRIPDRLGAGARHHRHRR